MPRQPFLEIGEVVGTHGVRGEMRVQPWCDSPHQFEALKVLYTDATGATSWHIHARAHGNLALVKVDGIDNVTAASAKRGTVLYVRREDLKLPADRHFICDLIGMTVVDADSGECYGRLTDVSHTGANDVYHMRQEKTGRTILIPVIPSVVKQVDYETDCVRICPIKGLFDDED